VLVRHLLADVGYLGADLEHDPLDAAPDRKITTWRAPRRQARQRGQGDTSDLVDQFIDIALAHQGPRLLLNPDAQQRRLGRCQLSISRSARRLLPLAPQVPQVGNSARVEREAVTLPLDHAFGFELADVGPAAIEVQRADALTVARFLDCGRETGLATDGRSTVPVSVIVFIPVA